MSTSSLQLKPRVFVTGGSGFLGQNVVKFLAAKGYDGMILDVRKPTDPDLAAILNGGNWSFCIYDLGNPDTLKAIPLSSDPVHLMHLASKVHTSNALTQEVASEIQSQVGGIFPLLDYLGSSLVGVSLTSTIETYGVPQKLPIDERHSTHPFNIYGAAKLTLEYFLNIYCRKNKIPLTILRLPQIYGPGDTYAKAIPTFIQNCLQGKPLALVNEGADRREYIHVGDIGLALLLAMENKTEGIFNITGGRPVSISETLQAIQDLCGSKLPVQNIISNKHALHYEFDISKAKHDLGYTPSISLEEGLRSEIQWFKEHMV